MANSSVAGPLPKFEGVTIPSLPAPAPVPPPPPAFTPTSTGSLQPQISGGPIRVPPLPPQKAAEYAGLFEKSGAQGGILSGKSLEYYLVNHELIGLR